MWYADPFNVMLSFIVFMIYAVVCGIAILFTFFLDIYLQMDDRFNMELLPSRPVTPLEQNLRGFDDWLKGNHKIIGPLLIILSMVDLKLFFNIVEKL